MLKDLLTLEHIQEAYRETGVIPSQHSYLKTQEAPGNPLCACPLGVLAYRKDPSLAQQPSISRTKCMEILLGTMIPHSEWAWSDGFTHGFDNVPTLTAYTSPESRQQYQEGYDHGQVIAQALQEAGVL